MRAQPFITCLSIALILSACQNTVESNVETIVGSGNIITVEREVSNFSRIQINMGADLVLTQTGEANLAVEADDNFMTYIETEVSGDRLVVSTPDNINLEATQPIQLTVTFDDLREIEINGRSAITAENIDLDALTVRFSGSGSTTLAGVVNHQTITIRGMATINNANLVSQRVMIDISGSGTIEVNAEETLDVSIAGTGNIRYTGDPTITQDISGSGTIVRMQ